MKFPVFSLLAGNFGFRDGFARDCLLQQWSLVRTWFCRRLPYPARYTPRSAMRRACVHLARVIRLGASRNPSETAKSLIFGRDGGRSVIGRGGSEDEKREAAVLRNSRARIRIGSRMLCRKSTKTMPAQEQEDPRTGSYTRSLLPSARHAPIGDIPSAGTLGSLIHVSDAAIDGAVGRPDHGPERFPCHRSGEGRGVHAIGDPHHLVRIGAVVA